MGLLERRSQILNPILFLVLMCHLAVATIVAGWPEAFTAARARSLGFTCESSYDQIVQAHLDDDRA